MTLREKIEDCVVSDKQLADIESRATETNPSGFTSFRAEMLQHQLPVCKAFNEAAKLIMLLAGTQLDKEVSPEAEELFVPMEAAKRLLLEVYIKDKKPCTRYVTIA